MNKKSKPLIGVVICKKSYTKVSFKPDLERFGLKSLSDDFVKVIKRRLIDIGFASSAKVKMYFNGGEISKALQSPNLGLAVIAVSTVTSYALNCRLDSSGLLQSTLWRLA